MKDLRTSKACPFVFALAILASAGASPLEAAGPRWRFDARGAVRGSPRVAQGVVYVGSGDGNLYAVDEKAGRELWHTDMGAPVIGTPAISADLGTIFVTSRAPYLHALDRRTGKMRWRFRTGEPLPFLWGFDFWASSPALSGNAVYFGAVDGHVYAVDARTGREIWKFATKGRVLASPAVDRGVVYVGSVDGRLYALDAATGRPAFTFETKGVGIDSEKVGFDRTSIVSSPALSDELVYFGGRDGFFYAVERKTGRERWRYDHQVSWVMSSPRLSSALVFVGSSDGHFFHALRAATGEEVWRFRTSGRVLSSGAVAEEGDSGPGVVYFGCSDGRLYAVDAQTGVERWRFTTGDQILSSPFVSNGSVFVGSDDGGLYAFSLRPARRGTQGLPRRAVFWHEDWRSPWFKGGRELSQYLAGEGYVVLDAPALVRFVKQRLSDREPSVIVAATERLPAELLAETGQGPATSLLRRYMASSGRLVCVGFPPGALRFDEKTGAPAGFDLSAPERLLGVRLSGGSSDPLPVAPTALQSRATALGRAWGLPAWWIGSLAIDPGHVETVLGLDEFGRASAWARTYGGGPGTGFVKVWGSEGSIKDPSWVQAVAEHGLE